MIDATHYSNNLVVEQFVFFMFRQFINFFFYSFIFFTCSSWQAFAWEKDRKVIQLAVSNATKGPAAQLGFRLNQGASAYFNRINHSGGINGYRVEMLLRDDGYEPYKTLTNTHKFLKNENLFGFFNYVGTPTTFAIHQTVADSGLPFLMPFTGADFLRSPITPNIYNLRASYNQEAQAQIKYLIETKGIKKIGLLVQADEFGRAVERGYAKVLKSYGIEPVITTRYRRNTQDIATALDVLITKEVEAVAFVGTYNPLAELINSAYKKQFTPIFTTVSFISSQDLFKLIEQPSKIVVTEVMPDPKTCQYEYCFQFIKDMAAIGIKEFDRIQLEGYLNAHLFTQVASLCSSITPSCFLNKIQHFNMNSLGLKVEYSPTDHQGLDEVYLNFFSQ